jgi:hypothetical protein
MIITVEDLKKRVNCGTATDDLITAKLEAIEAVIRAYTNNNFQQRPVRFAGRSEDFRVYGSPRFFAVGDTVQISGSGVNDGLYVVMVVDGDHLELDKPLMPTQFNLVTKISYPADVIQCAVDLFKWNQTMGDKVGIKSETISRHSVTYEDSATLFMGYPVGILNGLNLHKKARC